VIELRNVRKVLGRRRVLDGLSLLVSPGECVAITGVSGAGKTTLLRLVAGFETPDEGAVLLRGVEVSRPGWALAPHARALGFQFQESALWPHMNLRANVAFGLHTDGTRADDCLARAGLSEMADRYPGEVSGGEARRAALARALAPGRNILLLDEPLANLQPELCAGMARWIAAELRAASAACLWVAHHPEESAGVATRVLVLSNGRFG
jgi:iron(III) transport system ATP-binding protein